MYQPAGRNTNILHIRIEVLRAKFVFSKICRFLKHDSAMDETLSPSFTITSRYVVPLNQSPGSD